MPSPLDINRGVTMYRRVVGGNVYEIRRSLGISQEELAQAAGCGSATISGCENARHAPSVDTLYRIALALGVTPSRLMLVEGERKEAR